MAAGPTFTTDTMDYKDANGTYQTAEPQVVEGQVWKVFACPGANAYANITKLKGTYSPFGDGATWVIKHQSCNATLDGNGNWEIQFPANHFSENQLSVVSPGNGAGSEASRNAAQVNETGALKKAQFGTPGS